jgi:hypothetical protein
MQPQQAQTWNTATQSYGTPTNTATQQQAPVAQAAATTGTSSLFQPGYLGAPATVNPALVNAPTASGTTAQGTYAPTSQLSQGLLGSLGSGATIQQLLQGYAPQEQNGQNQLTQMLANFGVGGGQAVGAENQFQGQEAAGLAPSIAAAIQNSQANQLGAGEFDTSALNTGSQFNANLGQANNQFNATQGQQNNQFNAGNALTAALNNQQSTNSAAGQNATDINSTNLTNTNIQNTAQQQELSDLLNQYALQLGSFNAINTGGQSAGNQNAVNYGQDITVQQDPFTQIFGDLAGAGGQIGSAAIKAA